MIDFMISKKNRINQSTTQHQPASFKENLSSVNAIVSSYRDNSCELWAQLAVKYQLPPVEALQLLAKTWPGRRPGGRNGSRFGGKKRVLEKIWLIYGLSMDYL